MSFVWVFFSNSKIPEDCGEEYETYEWIEAEQLEKSMITAVSEFNTMTKKNLDPPIQ